MTVVAKFLRMLVRLYQLTLSPWVGRSCRFVPTCSNYAIEALEKYGAVKGTYLTIYRLLRWCRECRPEEQEDKGSTDLFNIQKK